MTKPNDREYRQFRRDTLRGIERERVKENARKLLAELRARKFHYPKSVDRALRRAAQ